MAVTAPDQQRIDPGPAQTDLPLVWPSLAAAITPTLILGPAFLFSDTIGGSPLTPLFGVPVGAAIIGTSHKLLRSMEPTDDKPTAPTSSVVRNMAAATLLFTMASLAMVWSLATSAGIDTGIERWSGPAVFAMAGFAYLLVRHGSAAHLAVATGLAIALAWLSVVEIATIGNEYGGPWTPKVHGYGIWVFALSATLSALFLTVASARRTARFNPVRLATHVFGFWAPAILLVLLFASNQPTSEVPCCDTQVETSIN